MTFINDQGVKIDGNNVVAFVSDLKKLKGIDSLKKLELDLEDLRSEKVLKSLHIPIWDPDTVLKSKQKTIVICLLFCYNFISKEI